MDEDKPASRREVDQRLDYLSRAVDEAKNVADSARDKADRAMEILTDRVNALALKVEARDNHSQGISHSWAIVLAVGGFAVTILTIFNFLRH